MQEKNEEKQTRPPIVAVLGHIDHGKSTLLDFIRKQNTVEKEAGGITQKVSAYEVEFGKSKNKITFLDTPGHEAFCSIREICSKITDLAILVVSAEDSVKKQTLEAIKCLDENQTPFIVAINKIDKPNANIERTKQNLAENNVLVEDWGGKVISVPISAKTGDGVEDLLEMVLLQAEILELETDRNQKAEGFVVETIIDPKKGTSAILVIKNGTLNVGDHLATKESFVAVRNIATIDNKIVEKAWASSPVVISGWKGVPPAGESFYTFKTKNEAEGFVNANNKIQKSTFEKTDKIDLPIIVKTDNLGSLNAIIYEIEKIVNEKIRIKIISQNIGAITENDIKFAISSKAEVIGFNTNCDKNALNLSMRDNVSIKTFSIIYELIDYLKSRISEMEPKEEKETIIGRAKILKTFSRNKDKQVLGARVEEGEIKSGSTTKILRRENEIGSGRIKELQSQRTKADKVSEGQEFGANVESKIEILPGDILLAITKTIYE